MNFKNLLPALNVGQVDVNLSVETAGPCECGVKNVRTVCCSHYDNAVVGLEAVHLNQDLVERLFAFVVAAAKSCTPLPAHCIDFIDKDDAGLIFLSHIK